MPDFTFITIRELRRGLESDYAELCSCLEARAWKAAHVLAGSIIEAVLIDSLYAEKGVDTAKLDSMELGPLVELCKTKGILSDETVNLSTVVQNYRNLIHPGRVKRLEKTVGQSGARVAVELVNILITEVAKRKQATYGYTAEQLFNRLKGGSSALPLVTHLLNDSQDSEVERLLTDILPKAYFDATQDIDVTATEVNHLLSCYRAVYETAADRIKTIAMKDIYRIYREADEAVVVEYEENFLRAKDLRLLSETERNFIKAHLLPRLHVGTVPRLFRTIEGIGPYLTPAEARPFAMALAWNIVGEDRQLGTKSKYCLLDEYERMVPECRGSVYSQVEDVCTNWIDVDDPSSGVWKSILTWLKQREAKVTKETKTQAAE